jgi:hypothetical protein
VGYVNTKRPVASQKHHGCKDFHRWIADRDTLATIATAAAQQEPTDNRNIVTPADGRPASAAVGGWSNDRFIMRNAADANVEETTECQSRYEQSAFPESVQALDGASLLDPGRTADRR